MILYEYDDEILIPSCKVPLKIIKTLPLPYIGNKKKLIPKIHEAIAKNNICFNSILDGFSGSSSLSYLFKRMNKSVVSNDLLTFSYNNSLAFVQNNSTKLSNNEIEFVLNNKSNHSNFVFDNFCGEKNSKSRFKKFTINECSFLDQFYANVMSLDCQYKRSLAFAAISAVILRLPFGNIDQSSDIMMHRKRQHDKYGKGTERHDRRIDIYYDKNFNLNFCKWFRKYLNDFHSAVTNGTAISTNMDIMDVLDNIPQKVDCIYLDPPYGGISSDYISMYRFLEEYIHQKPLEELTHIKNATNFIDKETYEHNFVKLLQKTSNIPILMLSYNDKSWKHIDDIVDIIKEYRKKVTVEVLSGNYQYIYRKKCGDRKHKGFEYLIIAR